MAKHIFITGGVVSGLGKGITGSSLGLLLKSAGINVFMQKFDPYLNIDPGTMSPYQHGEVFVTADGGETDLDLGHYERFTNTDLNKNSSVTSGRIYQSVLDRERMGGYEGKTVQVIPHITNAIKGFVYRAEETTGADVIITEIGGTIGDIESQPFVEAIRQVRMERGRENVMFIHVALLPYLRVSNEFKTKPIQHSVKEMLSLGIQPDVIVARTEGEVEEQMREKIALFCNINVENVIVCPDLPSIYNVPLHLESENLHNVVAQQLNFNLDKLDINWFKEFNHNIDNSNEEVEITVVGKYVELPDAYLSVIESLKLSGYEFKKKVKVKWIQAANINENNYQELLKDSKGILVPGGFGYRGVEGKILAAKYARENKVPYLGLCLGMQVACIEFARSVLELPDANSTEFDETTANGIIMLIEGKDREKIGGTLRLGLFPTTIQAGTLCHQLYGETLVHERHRHRYEFNNDYRERFEKAGMVFSGIYKEQGLVEVVEIKDHPFFIAAQYHPEFTSRPTKPNPLFKGFVEKVIELTK
jgi:CTP synthase